MNKFFIILLFSTTIIQAQVNLVYNGNFELFDTCPTNISTPGDYQIKHCLGWKSPTYATSDYYNSCYKDSFQQNASTPRNIIGYQIPKSGNGYCGLIPVDVNDNRYWFEYIQGKTTSPLKAGNTYQISFWVSCANYPKWTIKPISFYFTDSAIHKTNALPFNNINAQIVNTSGNLKDTLNWTEITGIYTALGGEKFITIGLFCDINYIDSIIPHKKKHHKNQNFFNSDSNWQTDNWNTDNNSNNWDTDYNSNKWDSDFFNDDWLDNYMNSNALYYLYIDDISIIKIKTPKKLEIVIDHQQMINNALPHQMVFLLDVSGSMQEYGKIDLLKEGTKYLVNLQRNSDHISLLTFSSHSHTLLKNISCDKKNTIFNKIDALQTHGATNANEGIKNAFGIADSNTIINGKNKIILVTDGKFQLNTEVINLLSTFKKKNIELIILLVGSNKDPKIDKEFKKMSKNGNGKYYKVDEKNLKDILVKEASY